MSTAVQLTGAPLVPATSQVMVWLVSADQLSDVFGWVTRKGPLLPSTFTIMLSWSLQPAPEALSRTVSRKV